MASSSTVRSAVDAQASNPVPHVVGDAHGVVRRRWQTAYIRRLAVTDALVVTAAVATAQWWRFGGSDARCTRSPSTTSATHSFP